MGDRVTNGCGDLKEAVWAGKKSLIKDLQTQGARTIHSSCGATKRLIILNINRF